MKQIVLALGIVSVLAITSSPALGQGRDRDTTKVPPSHLPPPGMCRIWLDNVPPGQQPAPTDCASAVRNRPSNGRVIFNDVGKKQRLPVKSLKESERRRPDERKGPPEVKPPEGEKASR